MLVVDASVIVKWVVAGPHADSARRIIESTTTMQAPDLIWAELTNVVWTYARQKLVAPTDAREALADLHQLAIRTHPARPLTAAALDLGLALGISAHDSFYIALAAREGVPLVTADRRLFDALRKSAAGHGAMWIADF